MSGPRIGLIARADNTGLGMQTWELYKHFKPNKTYIIDLTAVNAANGKQTGLFLDRYPTDAVVIDGFPGIEQCKEMLANIDVLLSVEIPYNYSLFNLAHEWGVKTVLQYNYEFLDYLADPYLPWPDMLLAPSKWHYEDVRDLARLAAPKTRIMFLPVPVNRDLIPFRQRTEANHFVHVAGHATFEDRNGTNLVLEALKYITSDIKLTIHSQHPLDVVDYPWVTVLDTEVKEYQDIYNNPLYDVMILPRRYGGLSLQLNEALSAGMPVIMPDVSPNYHNLPREALVQADEGVPIRTRTEFLCHSVDPKRLAQKIDEFHNDPPLVKKMSHEADRYAQQISWDEMLPKYKQALEDICQQ